MRYSHVRGSIYCYTKKLVKKSGGGWAFKSATSSLGIKNIVSDLSKSLRQLMGESGTTIQDITRLCGVARSSVHTWLRGGNIRENHVETLAEHFKVHPSVIRYGSPSLDVDLMAEVIVDVREGIAKAGKSVSPETQAAIIALAYQAFSANGETSYRQLIEGVRHLADIGNK